MKKLFKSSKNTPKQTVETSGQGVKFEDLLRAKPTESADHKFHFGVIYANDLAKIEFGKENPKFSIGSIIVREKNETETSIMPVSVIAMVKREKGFSKETGDWEFFTFNGADLKLKTRETKGDCAACHITAEKTDWVFREYLK